MEKTEPDFRSPERDAVLKKHVSFRDSVLQAVRDGLMSPDRAIETLRLNEVEAQCVRHMAPPNNGGK